MVIISLEHILHETLSTNKETKVANKFVILENLSSICKVLLNFESKIPNRRRKLDKNALSCK